MSQCPTFFEAASLIAATILLLLLIVIYQRRWIGGGDSKLAGRICIQRNYGSNIFEICLNQVGSRFYQSVAAMSVATAISH